MSLLQSNMKHLSRNESPKKAHADLVRVKRLRPLHRQLCVHAAQAEAQARRSSVWRMRNARQGITPFARFVDCILERICLWCSSFVPVGALAGKWRFRTARACHRPRQLQTTSSSRWTLPSKANVFNGRVPRTLMIISSTHTLIVRLGLKTEEKEFSIANVD